MKKKYIIKFVISIIVIISITSFSFAYQVINQNESSSISLLSRITDIFNIIWLPFAILAGKLFSNDLVYGSLFGLDNILFKIWNFSKVFANYIIWIIFIGSIFGYFIWKVKNLLQILWKIVIASVLINASWFLLWALIDLSTSAITIAGSLPMHLMGTSTTGPTQKIKYCSVLEIDPVAAWRFVKNDSNITVCAKWSEKEMSTEDFFSKMNNITGPLIFIWTSILNIDKNWEADKQQIKNNEDVVKTAKIKNLIHIMVVLLFVVPIILLVIIWIVRVFWLWVYIAFSPILVLDYVFWWKYISSKNKNLKLWNAVGLIFQPVLIIMAMWIVIIFLSAVQTAFIWGNNSDVKTNLGICENSNKSLCINDKVIVTIEWDLNKWFMEEVWWAFGYIIISLLTFVMMWWLLKLAFTSNDITSSIATNTFEFAEEWLKAVPIIPTKLWGVWIWAMERMLGRNFIKSKFEARAANQAEKLTWVINNIFWVWETSIWIGLEKKYLEKLNDSNGSYSQVQAVFKEFLEEVKEKKPNVIPESDIYFKNVVFHIIDVWRKKDTSLNKVLKKYWIDLKKLSSSEELFKNTNFKIFLTGLIKDPSLLSWKTAEIIDNQAFNKWGANLLASKISEIK